MSSPSPMGGNNQMLDRVIPVVIGCLIALFIFKMLNKDKQENFKQENFKFNAFEAYSKYKNELRQCNIKNKCKQIGKDCRVECLYTLCFKLCRKSKGIEYCKNTCMKKVFR